jgi:hypothetical protein
MRIKTVFSHVISTAPIRDGTLSISRAILMLDFQQSRLWEIVGEIYRLHGVCLSSWPRRRQSVDVGNARDRYLARRGAQWATTRAA